MSRMTKYLRQKTSWERAISLDSYGEPTYAGPVQLPCRREQVIRDTQSGVGSTLMQQTRYYLDDVATVKVGDKLDGYPVQAVEEYTGNLGQREGFLCLVAQGPSLI